VGSVLKPAGLDKSVGLISMLYIKDGSDAKWDNDPTMKEFKALIKKYTPEVSPDDANATFAYATAEMMVHVLKQAGDNLTRENLMKQAANIKDFQVPMVLPGVLANTTPTDFALFQTMQLVKFDGKNWVDFGKPVAVK
jgi:branched-chain amino acid transport system substrate-binding protein